MSKTTRSLSGASQRKYFQRLFRAQEGIASETAEALTQTCTREIAHVRVRLPIPERTSRATNPAGTSAAENPVATDAAGEFDPFAFSVVVVLTREGREGLLRRLAGISERAHLLDLARAQHIGLPADEPELDDLREAIVQGAARRIANRQAAAS